MDIPNIYNPANQSKDEIIKNFVIREKEFNDLFTSIKKDPMKNAPQHYIIQGLRGNGKTTLLLRLCYEIQNDKKLNKWLIPVIFNEEQYNIRTLYKLWENIAKYLERENGVFTGLYERMDENYGKEDYEEKCYDLLKSVLNENKKKLIVFIDNFGLMLEKLSRKEQQRFREVLLTCSVIRIVGASAEMLEATYDYSKPFFDFFKIVNLGSLTSDETKKLLIKLDETYKTGSMKKIIDEQPGRIEALRRLTNGVPRTIVLLYEIFTDNLHGNSFKDLETVLDRVTPLYKHRMDDLSAQQQEITHVISMNWDAIAVKEIVKLSRLESNAVSSQLKQLEKNGIIEKEETSTKNNLYRISERFFNIWYLMRHGKRNDKNRVLWLVQFLEIWCDNNELIARTKKHIQGLKEGKLHEKHAFYMTEALAKTNISRDLQHELIETARKSDCLKNSELLKELPKSDKEIIWEVQEPITNYGSEYVRNKIDKIRNIEKDYIFAQSLEKISNFIEAEKYYLLAVEKGHTDAMFNLANLYCAEFKEFRKAEKYYLLAVGKGHVNSMYNLALLYRTEFKDFKKAEIYYLLAVEKGDVIALNNLANLYQNEFKDFQKAEEYYLKAVEYRIKESMFNLANLYRFKYKDFKKAEKYYLMAVENGDENAIRNLAVLYFEEKREKSRALELAKKSFNTDVDYVRARLLTFALLWNNEIEEAIEISIIFTDNIEVFEKHISDFQLFIMMLLAKKQYYYTFNLFKENKFDIKDRFKPLYYALMYFMQREYPDEYLKMGSELKQTVEEIVASIKQMEIDYA